MCAGGKLNLDFQYSFFLRRGLHGGTKQRLRMTHAIDTRLFLNNSFLDNFEWVSSLVGNACYLFLSILLMK